MAKTVSEAFNKFSKDSVDLDTSDVKKARESQNWLINQLEEFPIEDNHFPSLYPDKFILNYGSFARKTKIRPLDDIDFLLIFAAEGSSFSNDSPSPYEITVPETATKLLKYCDNNKLNSRKLLEKLKKSLEGVSQYSKADIHRNQEAVTLKLTSYDWNFDIVTAFITVPLEDSIQYYLIPDGNGKWKKSNPVFDQDRITRLNQKFNGNVLKTVRLMKYWNNRKVAPTIRSYLLESMVLNWFDSQTSIGNVQNIIESVFNYLKTAVSNAVNDPPGIQGDINDMDVWDRIKISSAANKAAENASNANFYESISFHRKAIELWKIIFGDDFPNYE